MAGYEADLGRVPPGDRRRTWASGDDWVTLVETAESRRLLTRRITAFRRVGELHRGSEEVHRLRLHERSHIVSDVERAGFDAEVLDGCGRTSMLAGRVGFLAVKPAGSSHD
jgi:hypothetical protein